MEKTILELIDNVDQASAFAEYDVTSALLDTYMKSIMISESVQPTQEASLGIELNSPITGRYDESKLKKILMFIPRLLATVIRIVVKGIVAIFMVIPAVIRNERFEYRGKVYFPIDLSEFYRISHIVNIWIDDVRERFNIITDKYRVPEKDNRWKYVDVFPEFLSAVGSGHKFAISEDSIEFPPTEITIAQETNDIVQILRSYDDGGKNQKSLFKTSKDFADSIYGIEDSIGGLKKSARELISALNRANRYAFGRTANPEDYGESEGAAKLREILPQFRSDIAYIMNFFTKLSTKVTEAMSKQKVFNVNDAEFDDEE